jgi:SAM-dependent methyltransferase
VNTDDLTTFFYAEEDADIYDATIRLTTESYDLLHAQVRRLVAFWYTTCRRSADHCPLVVDVGSGTGVEAVGILNEIRNVDLVCIDASERMLGALQCKMTQEFGEPTAGGRCRSVQIDLRSENWIANAISAAGFSGRQVSLVVSVYALHHLDSSEKREIYCSIAHCLRPKGAFIYADLYSFRNRALADFAQRLEESWIATAFKQPGNDGVLSQAKLSQLAQAWLQHSQYENKPMPIHRDNRLCNSCDRDNGREQELLISAGFTSVEVPFRFFQNGIIWAET